MLKEGYNLVVLIDETSSSKIKPYLGGIPNQHSENSNSINSTNQKSSDDTSDGLDTFEQILLASICLIGAIGNFLVAFTLVARKQLKYPSNRLVLSLNVSSLLFCLLVLPFTLVEAISDSREWIFGHFWCKIVAFMTTLTTTVCAPTIALIAIDRYVAIARPMTYTNLVTVQRSTLIAAITWFLALILALPPLFEISRYEFDVVEHSCSINWSSEPIFTLFYVIVVVMIPLCVMTYCYTIILQVAMKKCQRVNLGLMDSLLLTTASGTNPPIPNGARLSTSTASTTSSTNFDDEAGKRQRQKVHRSRTIHTISGGPKVPIREELLNQSKIKPSASVGAMSSLGRFQSKMSSISSKRPSFTWLSYQSPRKGLLTILTLLGSFCITFIPISTFAILNAFHQDSGISTIFHRISVWLAIAGFGTNPIIYGLMNRAIRTEMVPALFQRSKRSKAMKGLPRKNSQRRISCIQSFSTATLMANNGHALKAHGQYPLRSQSLKEDLRAKRVKSAISPTKRSTFIIGEDDLELPDSPVCLKKPSEKLQQSHDGDVSDAGGEEVKVIHVDETTGKSRPKKNKLDLASSKARLTFRPLRKHQNHGQKKLRSHSLTPNHHQRLHRLDCHKALSKEQCRLMDEDICEAWVNDSPSGVQKSLDSTKRSQGPVHSFSLPTIFVTPPSRSGRPTPAMTSGKTSKTAPELQTMQKFSSLENDEGNSCTLEVIQKSPENILG